MSMTLTVPDDIAQAAQVIAKANGTTAESLLLRALAAHFPPVPEELQAEFDAWEAASDEDMSRFVESLEEEAA